MIDFICGKVINVKDSSITVLTNGIGLNFQIPQTHNIKEGDNVELQTYFHWNSDNGPSLFAFEKELDKTTFLLIIDCHKIGPKIAINILSQIPSEDFLEAVLQNDDKRLSNLNGIGAKKSEQIIIELKNKVTKLITTGKIQLQDKQSTMHWQNLSDALLSLGYSKPEVGSAFKFLREANLSDLSFDQLLRKSLGFLSKGI
ncbi:TPA: hypothetical protein DEO28_04570 [Candidatus Dependentiae bacterium]|nr:MAG: Holliday junction ATP-dependent DNA helicase RuvA [candidate division TM6 bacterium GW2011_GWE2_31_21]KKP53829.1 MAG: Holliday junction ATP-dependent DNA helicase RuvA [candidate division TM6 bacterium GW2011_GWF2_33_332]HBS47609.1 hypothetical protein [Candidatus Dependentiae bacterium]HBZ73758.1 hypothetical protein [Candidatus Dependentiae bacterium]